MNKSIQQIQDQESRVFSQYDLDQIQQYEYKGKVYIVGSSAYIRHVAALKAHVTRLRQYIKKKETSHNAAIKANKTRKSASDRMNPMSDRTENDLIKDNLLLEWK